jgi:hypothetical protein
MNKQLTKKTIGIAASAALMASVVLSGSALAGPGKKGGNKKGPQVSASVSTWCEITDEVNGVMRVNIRTEDKSTGDAADQAVIAAAHVNLVTKDGGPNWGDPLQTQYPYLVFGDDYVEFNLCGETLKKAINAQTTITLDTSIYPASKGAYTAQCGNAPGPDNTLGTDDDIIGGGLKTADYADLGKDCP